MSENTTHTITITLSRAAQAAALRGGQPAAAEQTHEVPLELVGRLLDLGAEVGPAGAVQADFRNRPLAARPTNVSAAIEAVEAQVASVRTAAREAAEREAESTARALAKMRGTAQTWLENLNTACRGLPEVVALRDCLADPAGDPGWHGGGIWGAADEAVTRAVRAEAEEARAAAAAAKRAEMKVWATEHGSERLRLAVAAGVECGTICADERRAIECPGWATTTAEALGVDSAGFPLEPRNPPLDALRALAAAGEGVSLGYVVAFRHDPDHEDADNDGDVRLGGQYVLSRQWRGETLYRAAARKKAAPSVAALVE